MSIPLPAPFYEMVYTTPKGEMTTDSKLYNNQLFFSVDNAIVALNSLCTTEVNQNIVTINGLSATIKTTAEITTLEPDVPHGTIWFNSTLKKLQVKTDDGVIETITST